MIKYYVIFINWLLQLHFRDIHFYLAGEQGGEHTALFLSETNRCYFFLQSKVEHTNDLLEQGRTLIDFLLAEAACGVTEHLVVVFLKAPLYLEKKGKLGVTVVHVTLLARASDAELQRCLLMSNSIHIAKA